MSGDSGSGPALASLEQLIVSLPPDTRLPSYRELQQRYRLSPATVQRLLSELARRGLLVTRPGSGTFTAARRGPRREADLSWQ
ncbi:MAG: GntR family transcriptional regulator, partial [Actinobacteria bacterium]|nr:GntR family transcriptional regulator [Actinomycetota bacterium]